MGRRVKKAVYDYAAGAWTLEKEKLFVYDGWNLVEEIRREGGTETSRYFVWGLDVSQSMQGAGGIGGLVAEVDAAGGSGGSSLTYYFCYDGNGNIGQVVNATDGSIAAAYEYDPYGKVLKADGDYAGDNPFRFSTKYTDDETGLVYYGYRYYSAELGRWLSRDPSGLRGGLSLYNYVNNQSISLFDPLGLNAYTAYRELGILQPMGHFLWKLFKSAGHVYLAFRVSGGDLSAEEEALWCAFLSERGYVKKDIPSNEHEYNEWITFSFHPRSVDEATGKTEGNILLTLITDGSYIDLNDQRNDIAPIISGNATKNLITDNIEEEFSLFERAEESMYYNPPGGDYAGVFQEFGTSYLNGYGFLRNNCGGWAKYVVDESGLSWPLMGYMYNLGVGVNGPLHYPARILDAAIRAITFGTLKIVEAGGSSPDVKPEWQSQMEDY